MTKRELELMAALVGLIAVAIPLVANFEPIAWLTAVLLVGLAAVASVDRS